MSTPKWIVLDRAWDWEHMLHALRKGSAGGVADEIERQLTHGPGVVVIDPEDISTVQRLEESFSELSDNLAYGSEHIDYVNAMAEALRSLLPTTKPPEPLGLGAVIEIPSVRDGFDGQPMLIVRGHASDKPWMGDNAKRDWSDITGPVKVLNEGVVTR